MRVLEKYMIENITEINSELCKKIIYTSFAKAL